MLKLSELEKELDDVEFPNGTVCKPIPFGPTEYRLWRDIQTETDATQRGMMLLKIVTACYPTATADDIDSCTPKMLIAMAAHAGRKIDQIRDALKNVGAVPEVEATVPPTDTTPSSQKPSGNTSSRSTRKRSAKTHGASTDANPTDAPNSSGTGTTNSQSLAESTPFAVNWTTSTERASQASP